jgi:glutamate/tyrosine decarboxylase-like PLP-dependent enzyme
MAKTPSSKNAQPKCDPKEVALKSFFLGPQAENASWVIQLLDSVFERWVSWRRSLFPNDGSAISLLDQKSKSFIERKENFEKVTMELLTRFEQEVPKFSPRYVGHMFSEVSLPALFGHVATLLHNPNNISGESSRVGTQIENEAIEELLSMVGYSVQGGTGHFTSGGTLANLEALIRAQSRMALWLAIEAALRAAGKSDSFDPTLAAHAGWERFDQALQRAKEISLSQSEISKWKMGFVNPRELSDRIEGLSGQEFLGPVMLVPENKHYSWKKGCRILGLGRDALWPIELDQEGKLSVDHLKRLLDRAIVKGRPVLMVVSVVGTTELGGIDPVHKVQDVLDHWKKGSGIHIWHHVDAAYGGYLRTLDLKNTPSLSLQNRNALTALLRVDSITLDPHKLGYVPYASGAFLTQDKRNYYFSTFDDAPYIDFDETQDRGPYTIEGSRSAAGAVATWMTAKTMGLNPDGYGLLLERTIRICKELGNKITKQALPIQLAPGCDTNILCFACAKTGEKISKSNLRTLRVFERFSPKHDESAFIVSKTVLHWNTHSTYLDKWTRSWGARRDADDLVLIRMTMMNPFFASREMTVNYADEYIQELLRVLGED